MRNLFKFLLVLATSLPLFAAAPFEYSPVFTNMTLISTPGVANRVTSLVGGGVVSNLYTGVLNGLGGTFIWNPDGPIASWDGVDILDKRIPSPTNETHTLGAGTLATATYSYRVVALTTTPAGKTVASTATTLAVTGPVGINVNWTQVPGATGYEVYGRTAGSELLIAQVGKVGTYLDTGALTPSGAMPATNSTMGVIGTWNRHFIKVFGKSPQSGDLTNDFPNLVLVPVITAAGPIGSATTTPVITFDAKGRLTTVTSAAISGVPPSGAAGGDLGGTYPNPTVVKASALTSGRVTLTVGGIFADDADLTFLTDTLTATKIIGSTSITDSGLTATRLTFAGVGGLLSDDADLTFATDTLTATKVIGSTSVTSPAIVGTTSITDNGLTATRITFAGVAGLLSDDADLTFATDTLTATKLTSTVITDSGLTATRLTFAGVGGLLSDDADMTFATDTLTVTKLIASTSLTDSGLTAGRVTFAGTGGILSDDADFTFATDTVTATKVLAPTSVSTPSIITASGALGITPAAGSGVNVTATADIAFNATQLVVDGPTGNIGAGTAAPGAALEVVRNSASTSVGSIQQFRVSNLQAVADQNRVAIGFILTGGDSTEIAAVKDGGTANEAAHLDFVTRGTGYDTRIRITSAGNVGIGTTTPLAKFSVNGGAAIGEDADPGDNNLKVVGLTTTGTLVVTTSSTHSYATASTVAVFDGSKNLVSSGVTTTTLAFLDATSSVQTQLNARVREPKYGTGDPNFDGVTGDDDGQMFMNTSTGEKWHWYLAGPYWTP